MSKIFKLFIDENIKTWKKFSTKLTIILIILALVGVLGLVKIMQNVNENSEVTYSTFDWRTEIKYELESYKKALETENLDEETKRNMEMQVEKCELAIKYDISPFNGSFWKSTILDQIVELKYEDGKETETSKLVEMLEKDDFVGYIETQKEIAKKSLENKEILQQEYNDKISALNLQAKYEIGKNEKEEYWKNVVLTQIQSFQKSVRTGIDYKTNKVLTVEQKQEYEEKIKIGIYRLENNMPPIEYADENYRMIFETLAPSFLTAVIAIFAMIIAGGAISSEVSTGTIKFWVLTPNKRWKILTAKILSLLFYIITITLVVSLLTIAFSNLFFNENGNEYLYVKDGNVEKVGNTLFTIEYYFAKMIPVIIFALFSLMLSVVARNTSVAIGFGIATYMGNGIAMMIINSYIKKDWVKFIPFNNLNIADKIFSNFTNPISMLGMNSAPTTSLTFSFGVLAVCVILMIVTMYDSFNNRDII